MSEGLFGVSIEEQIACVEREISMRVHVYARRVLAKQMTQKTADKELAHMRAVLATLKSIKEKPACSSSN